MYLRIFYLFSFSLLISFYFMTYFKKMVISPESDLQDTLYKSCSPLILGSEKLILDFDVRIEKKEIFINVLGLKNNYLFNESVDIIYAKIKRNSSGREITISVMGQNNERLYSKTYR